MVESISRSPLLTPAFMAQSIKVQRELDGLQSLILKDRMTEIEMTKKEHQNFRKEQLQKIAEAALKNSQVNGWTLFSKYVSYAAGASSIVAGSALCATGAGAIPGAALIATGAFTLASQVCVESGVTELIAAQVAQGDRQKAVKVKSQIDLGLAISTTVLSLGTAFINMAQVATVAARVATSVIQGLSAGCEGIAAIGLGASKQAETKSSAETDLIHKKVESKTRKLEHLQEKIFENSDTLGKIVMDSRRRITNLFHTGA